MTYHCKNTVGYYDVERRTYRKGLKLLAWNDVEILPRGSHRLRYEAIVDECKVICFVFKQYKRSSIKNYANLLFIYFLFFFSDET